MGANTRHPQYNHRLPDWIKCRDAYNGERSVKAAGVSYLPKLSGQSEEEYRAYKERALFYSITDKTVSALTGMAMSKPPTLKYPSKLAYMFEDHSGTEFYEVLSTTVSETLLNARFGLLCDRSSNGSKPKITMYTAESIVNWRTNDDGEPTMVMLQESYYQEGSDGYTLDEKIRYRELYLDEQGIYRQRLHQSNGISDKFDIVLEITPVNTGVPMNFIPFVCVNPKGIGFADVKPPVLDIVNINISHYRTSADLEHGRHFTGLPTPYVIGAPSETVLRIGSSTAWVVTDPNASVGYLEFTGQGLGSLEKALQEKQSQLASLSARLIDNSSRGSEAAETVRLRYMSETSSLRSVVQAVEAALNRAYAFCATMEGQPEKSVSITLTKDFLDQSMTPQMLTALVKAYLDGAITQEIFIYNLTKGDILPPPGQDIGTFPKVDPNKPSQKQESGQPVA